MKKEQSTYLIAIGLLARQGYSRHKLRQKLLQKDLDPIEVDLALDRLTEEKYLQEDVYRRALIEKLLLKKWAPSLIKEKLRQQHLISTPDEIQALQTKLQISDDDAIRALILKKMPSKMPTDWPGHLKLQHKIASFLMGKGYRYEHFRQALGEMLPKFKNENHQKNQHADSFLSEEID